MEIALGRKINLPPPPLPLEKKYRELAKRALPDNKNYIGFAPGAGDTRKCWNLNNFIEVAKYFSDHNKIPVFFLGPKEENWLKIQTSLYISIFAKLLVRKNKEIDIIGSPNFEQ